VNELVRLLFFCVFFFQRLPLLLMEMSLHVGEVRVRVGGDS
jgi:hypothetical protein